MLKNIYLEQKNTYFHKKKKGGEPEERWNLINDNINIILNKDENIKKFYDNNLKHLKEIIKAKQDEQKRLYNNNLEQRYVKEIETSVLLNFVKLIIKYFSHYNTLSTEEFIKYIERGL